MKNNGEFEEKEIKYEEVEIKKKRVNKSKKKGLNNFINKHNESIISVVVTILICLILFILFYKFYLSNLVVEKTRLEKDVTITDVGIADAVEKVYDSVVVIETYVNNKAYASGTGFVFKTDKKYGYIMTNHHVINNSTSIKVTFTNNEKIEAKVIGSDEYADIAVLAVDKDKVLSTCKTGSSSSMRVGDTTFAVGAPLDATVYSWTVTRGILSGKDRTVEVSASTYGSAKYIMEVLQTDTAINSGNSGGPLCNSNGEVIGVTNMKLASSSVEGMGFAIPIEEALKYAESFIKNEPIVRPYIGVSIYDASDFWFSTETGIYIQTIEKNGPADKAGLKVGDKILKVNGTEVDNSSFFKYELYKYKVGDKVTITIERDGKEKDIKVTLGTNAQLN